MLGSPQLTPENLWKINKLYHTPENSRIFLCSPGAAQDVTHMKKKGLLILFKYITIIVRFVSQTLLALVGITACVSC